MNKIVIRIVILGCLNVQTLENVFLVVSRVMGMMIVMTGLMKLIPFAVCLFNIKNIFNKKYILENPERNCTAEEFRCTNHKVL